MIVSYVLYTHVQELIKENKDTTVEHLVNYTQNKNTVIFYLFLQMDQKTQNLEEK